MRFKLESRLTAAILLTCTLTCTVSYKILFARIGRNQFCYVLYICDKIISIKFIYNTNNDLITSLGT